MVLLIKATSSLCKAKHPESYSGVTSILSFSCVSVRNLTRGVPNISFEEFLDDTVDFRFRASSILWLLLSSCLDLAPAPALKRINAGRIKMKATPLHMTKSNSPSCWYFKSRNQQFRPGTSIVRKLNKQEEDKLREEANHVGLPMEVVDALLEEQTVDSNAVVKYFIC
jgi:hypothetical protein